MTRIRRSAIGVTIAALFWAAGTPIAAAQTSGKSPTLLRWFTTASTSTNHVAALQLAQAISSNSSKVRISVHDSTGALENMRRLRAGSTELVNMTTDLAYNALHGKGPYDGKPFPEIRNVLTTQVLSYTIVVSADAGVTTLEGLAGKKFSPGFTGASTTVTIMKELELLGIKPDYVPLSLRDAIDGMKNGRIIGFAKGAAVPDASVLEISTGGPVRLLQPTAAQLKELVGKMPGITTATQKIPGGLYAGIEKDTEYSQLGFGLFVGASSKLPQAVTYELTKEAVTNWQKALQGVKGFAAADPLKLTISSSTVPLAAGTVQYLKEKGVHVPADLVPPEYKDAN